MKISQVDEWNSSETSKGLAFIKKIFRNSAKAHINVKRLKEKHMEEKTINSIPEKPPKHGKTR